MTALLLEHLRNIPTIRVIDRRWGLDIYEVDRDGQVGYDADDHGFPVHWGYPDLGRVGNVEAVVDRLRRRSYTTHPLPDLTRQLDGAAKTLAINTSRGLRTVADCLRDPEIRRLCNEAAKAGKAWTGELDPFARRPVQREAIARSSARLQRCADRRVAKSARAGEAGRAARGLAARREQQERRRRKRLVARYRELIEPAMGRLYRTATAGDHTLQLSIGTPHASGQSSLGDTYSRRCTWRRTDSEHNLTVAARWKERVYDRGLTVIGGHLVLDAQKVRGRAGQYDVVIVEQDRGFAISSRRTRVLVERELPAQGEDDRLQIMLPEVVSHSDEGTVICDQECRIVQVVVYDATTGERHHLTVPPKFGRELARGESEADRVRAALAWTFGLSASQYGVAVSA